MTTKKSERRLRTINYTRPAFVSGFVLLIALIATLTYDDFNWGPGDFVGMGIFIYVFGLIFEIALIKISKHRKIVGILILLVFLMVYGLMATTE